MDLKFFINIELTVKSYLHSPLISGNSAEFMRELCQTLESEYRKKNPVVEWKSWWRANDAPELHCYIVVYFKH